MTHTLFDLLDVRLTEEDGSGGDPGEIHIIATAQGPRVPRETALQDIGTRHTCTDRPGRRRPADREGLSGWSTEGMGEVGRAQHHRDKEYIENFSPFLLGVVLDCLKQLSAVPGSRVGGSCTSGNPLQTICHGFTRVNWRHIKQIEMTRSLLTSHSFLKQESNRSNATIEMGQRYTHQQSDGNST